MRFLLLGTFVATVLNASRFDFRQQAAQQQQPVQQAQQAPAAVNDQQLISFEACKEDIHKYCDANKVNLQSDMAILECLQDAGQTETTTLTQACESLVWQFKVKLTQDDRFTDKAKEFCSEELKTNTEMAKCVTMTKPGYALSCFLDFVQNVTQTSKCYHFLSRTERLAFSDFRLIGPFVEKCRNVIEKFNCNILTPDKAHNGVRVPHTQGMALECIISKVVKSSKTQQDALTQLDNECRHEVMRLAEMQADDFNLDRPLFFACRHDREKYCKDVPAGQGNVFQCLLQNRGDKFMEPACANILAERAYMMGRDYRMASPLIKACEADMNKYKCQPQTQLESAAHFHLSYILLCLENAAHAQKENAPSQDCQREMLQHRQMMLSEFRMAPELVMSCAQEIDQWCSPRGDIEGQGITLHCLMQHAQERDEKKRLGVQCMQAVNQVIKVADIGSNYKVDKVLYASCKPLIDGPCQQDAQSEAATLTCLMKHVDSPDMDKMCEKRLLEVQYFMARDWTLDPQLYNACHGEAVSLCSAMDNWHMSNNVNNAPDPGPAVLACLYRSAYNEEKPLSMACGMEVRRILHTRAVRVNLIPDLEDSCRDALSEFCSHNVQPMEEMQCLQDNFEKKDFSQRHPTCYKEVVRFTEMQSKDTKLNQALTRACKPVITTYCSQFQNEEIDHGDVMECLLRNKDTREMTSKCKSYVNHFELVSLRDYHFSYKFQKACTSDIQRHCKDHGNDKGEIIRCLSEVRFEHKVLGTKEDLTVECKKQLKTAYLQQAEVEFDDKEHMAEADPTLSKKCEREIVQYKCNNENTFEDTIECLRRNFDGLGPECKSMIFYREKIEAVDNSMDDELQRNCKYDIEKSCSNYPPERVLECLSNTQVVRRLQRQCKAIVKERLEESARDVRLRPGLLQACQDEAKTYCSEDMEKIKRTEYGQTMLEGVVVMCLREKYRRSVHDPFHIGPACVEEITKIILEAEFDPKLDPALYHACSNVIGLHCSGAVISGGGHFDSVMECLRADFYKGAIADQKCAAELARRTEETLVDIHLDPTLNEACGNEVQTLCKDVQPGHSRIVMCLMQASDSTNARMSANCRNTLMDRNKLWMKAHSEYQMALPENWEQLANFIVNHPHRISILGWLGGVVFFILLVGCCCGRLSNRRQHELLKNR